MLCIFDLAHEIPWFSIIRLQSISTIHRNMKSFQNSNTISIVIIWICMVLVGVFLDISQWVCEYSMYHIEYSYLANIFGHRNWVVIERSKAYWFYTQTHMHLANYGRNNINHKLSHYLCYVSHIPSLWHIKYTQTNFQWAHTIYLDGQNEKDHWLHELFLLLLESRLQSHSRVRMKCPN